MATRRSKNRLMGFGLLLAAVGVGAWQSEKIKELFNKVTGKAS